jgi:hypothetical protein
MTMAHRWIALAAAATFVMANARATPPHDPVDVTVHEWGTFTSVAGADGKAVEWLPQSGPPDLPSFVERVHTSTKGCLPGTIRMETPVLYFYAPEDTSVDVRVRFRGGVISEWYPRAEVRPGLVNDATLRKPGFSGTAVWNRVRILPGAADRFLTEHQASHYYAARATDAAPLRVGGQTEKFLFYRGVGRFDPALSATVGADGAIVVEAPAGRTVGDTILFENRGGRVGYAVRGRLPVRAELQRPALTADRHALSGELERLLIGHGLYEKEAAAMIATWRDSWFEEGARLLYIVPKETVEAILPLEIDPAPASLARVFVGRIEIITGATERAVSDAIATYDFATLAMYGRFIRPIADRLLAQTRLSERGRLEARLSAVYARLAPLVGCR